jgi:hypothetical protein
VSVTRAVYLLLLPCLPPSPSGSEMAVWQELRLGRRRPAGRRAAATRRRAQGWLMAVLLLLVAVAAELSAAPVPAVPSGAVYINYVRPDHRQDIFLGFSGLDLTVHPDNGNPADDRGVFRLVTAPSSLPGQQRQQQDGRGLPAGQAGAGGFYIQNLWHGYTEHRYGDVVTVSPGGAADSLVLVAAATAAKNRVLWVAVPAGSSGGGSSSQGAFYLQNMNNPVNSSRVGLWLGTGDGSECDMVAGVGPKAQLCDRTHRGTWRAVEAPSPQAPPIYFQVAAGPHAGEFIGFSGHTVTCHHSSSVDQRGVWSLVGVAINSSSSSSSSSSNINPCGRVFYIENLWHKGKDSRAGDWLAFAGTGLVLSSSTADSARVPWALVPSATAANISGGGGGCGRGGGVGAKFYLQNRWRPGNDSRYGMWVGLTGKQEVSLVPQAALSSRVVLNSVAYVPPPPPPPPTPHCGDPTDPRAVPCVCPHVNRSSSRAGWAAPPPPPHCAPSAGPECRLPDCSNVSFLGRDARTRGNFVGTYGRRGYALFGLGQADSNRLPDFVHALAVGGAGVRQMAWPALATAGDPRALRNRGVNQYRALGFVATSQPMAGNASFSVAVTLNASSQGTEYMLSMYFVDFAGDGCSCLQPPACCESTSITGNCSGAVAAGRIQRVTVSSGATVAKQVAPPQLVGDFSGGVYLSYRVRGSVVVNVSQVCAARGEAMLSAVFFDTPPARSTAAHVV